MTGSWFAGQGRTGGIEAAAGSGAAGGGGAGPRLVCFPHAGGGSAFFHPWRQALEGEIEVCPVILPGRESRFREEPYRRMDELVDALYEGVQPVLDRPCAFLGHSLGAAVAFELAHRLRATGQPEPEVLFVSARRAPQEPDRRSAVSTLSDAELMRHMATLGGTPTSILAQRDLFALFTRSLRADLELNETYRRKQEPAEPPLSCPVVALCGDGDPLIEPAELDSWRQVTSGPFERHVFRGDHFYLSGRAPAVLDLVRKRMAG